MHVAAEPVVAEAAHLLDDRLQRLALLRQLVLDARRRLGVAAADDDSFRLEPAQPLRQRPRADPRTRVLELGEPARSLGEIVDEKNRPLRPDDLAVAATEHCPAWWTGSIVRDVSARAAMSQV